MSVYTVYAALAGLLCVTAGLWWRFRGSRIARTATTTPGRLTRNQVWQHTQALAEHYRSAHTKCGDQLADQVVVTLREFVRSVDSPIRENHL